MISVQNRNVACYATSKVTFPSEVAQYRTKVITLLAFPDVNLLFTVFRYVNKYMELLFKFQMKFHIYTLQIRQHTHTDRVGVDTDCLTCIQKSPFPMGRDSSVGIATGYRLDDRTIGVRFSEGAVYFSLHHRVQTGSGAHPASYTMGTGGSFPGGKAARA
jgi:hypothetical protein